MRGYWVSLLKLTGLPRKSEKGFALPAAMMMMVLIAGMTALIAQVSQGAQRQILPEHSILATYLAAEGALQQQMADMNVYGGLWDQQAALSTKPYAYTSYSPSTYTSTNGIPSCTMGVSCHRNYYPVGGGLLKNVGPLSGVGTTVDATYMLPDQLDLTSPQTADLTLGSISSWIQVERLEETTPTAATIGGNLSSSLAEGGNAKVVRFRLSSYAIRKLSGKVGVANLVSVVEMPVL